MIRDKTALREEIGEAVAAFLAAGGEIDRQPILVRGRTRQLRVFTDSGGRKDMKRIVGVNEHGLRVGEDHQNARLTDAEVDLLLELREEHGLSYSELAEKFGISKSGVRKICKGQTRSQRPERYKTVYVPS